MSRRDEILARLEAREDVRAALEGRVHIVEREFFAHAPEDIRWGLKCVDVLRDFLAWADSDEPDELETAAQKLSDKYAGITRFADSARAALAEGTS